MSSRKPGFQLMAALFWLAAGTASIAWVFTAVNLRSPYLLRVRETVCWIWLATGLLTLACALVWRKRMFTRPLPLHLVAIAFLAGAVLAGYGRWNHHRSLGIVNGMTKDTVPEIGRHLVIGWLGLDETRALAEKGAIAGVFLTYRDFPQGSTVADVRRTVDMLQAARKNAGLPPLWITTDQEGGAVEKLSPIIPRQPALGKRIGKLPPEELVRCVTDYADAQGKALAEAGINLNFSPVVDLMPKQAPDALDLHSHIGRRALSADPEIVALAAETYVRTLEKHGIKSVLKHFPGLGRVPADTHHFAATLDASALDLEATDWIPFREVSTRTGAGIMLGHVRLPAVDPVNPASCSRWIMHDLLRGQWGVNGLLVTDDFSMTPIFHGPGGISGAADKSLSAGVDLILLSYDAEAVYDLLASRKRPVR